MQPFSEAMGNANKPGQAIAILRAFSMHMMSTGSSAPVIPRSGQGRDPSGTTHSFYGYTLNEVLEVTKDNTVIAFTFENVACEYTLLYKKSELPTESTAPKDYDGELARQVELASRDWSLPPPKRTVGEQLHVVAYLKEGWSFHHITLDMVKTALLSLGLIILSKSRPATRHEDQQISGTQHEVLHFNVSAPLPFSKIPWPQNLIVQVPYTDDAGKPASIECALDYSILDEEMDKIMCTKGRCHQPFNVKGTCVCKALSSIKHDNFISKTKRMDARARGGPSASFADTPKIPSGTSSFLASMGASKSTVPCGYVSLGRCSYAIDGKTCGFQHPSDLEISEIRCRMGRSRANSEICKNGDKCKYNHYYNRTAKAIGFD
jgi:hypothetical protein